MTDNSSSTCLGWKARPLGFPEALLIRWVHDAGAIRRHLMGIVSDAECSRRASPPGKRSGVGGDAGPAEGSMRRPISCEEGAHVVDASGAVSIGVVAIATIHARRVVLAIELELPRHC